MVLPDIDLFECQSLLAGITDVALIKNIRHVVGDHVGSLVDIGIAAMLNGAGDLGGDRGANVADVHFIGDGERGGQGAEQ